jgi:hypothetical protein
MPQSGVVPLFGAADAKLFKMTADTSGGSTTYDNGVDVPGVQVLDITPEFINVELLGDNTVVDIYSRTKKIKGKMSFAKMSLDILKIILGGTLTDTGEGTSAQRRTYDVKKTDIPGYFKIELAVDYTGSENAGEGWHVVLPKAKLTNFSMSYAGEKHAAISFDFEAIPLLSNDLLMQKWHEDTLTAIVTTADSTAPTVSTVSPADAATGVAVTADVVITMSEGIRADTLTSDNFFIVRTDTGATIPAALAYDSGTFAITLNPTSNLTAAKTYNVFVVAARDLAGNKIASVFVSDFATA